ncbi:MAG TPA: hypothetical protein VFB41_06845 [Solirubrobacteraceae bacterium]|nr:hypothetical protein [Solirubrobacteraceae bacterium]
MSGSVQIAALAERIRDAAAAGDLERLLAVRAQMDATVAAAEPQRGDVPALRRALAAEREAGELLLAARAEIARRLSAASDRRAGLLRYGETAASTLNHSA